MATHRLSLEELRQLQELARQWAKLVSRRPFGDVGPDCGKPCPTEPHTHSLTAQGAEVEQTERVARCPDR